MAVHSQLASKFHFDTPIPPLQTLSGGLKWNFGDGGSFGARVKISF